MTAETSSTREETALTYNTGPAALATAPLQEVLDDLLAADEADDGQRLRDIGYSLVTRVSAAEAHAARLEATLGQRIAGLRVS